MSSDVTMTNAAQPQLKVGQRIVSDYIKGTVRFIGEVPPTKGEWIGVEWDDKERGKHSGEHNGTKYFDCLFPGTGSFTRISKKIETGSTLLEVLTERYVDKEKKMEDLYLGQSGVKVDVFDFDRVKDRQKNLDSMEIVGLANTNVERAADFDETQKACPAIKDLDLTSTLISTWQDVADICAPLTRLDILRLSRNRFQPLVEQPSFGQSFAKLRCLALNRVYLSWDEFEFLEPSMPNLQVLQIGFNMFTELGKTDPASPIASQKIKGLANLEDLHLEGNLLADWNQVLRLSHLPKLKTLDLSENKFINVIGPQDDNDFKTLTSLRLADNLIESWLSIDQIGLYTTLRSLWIGNNPVLTKPPQGQQINVPSSHGFDPRTESIVRLPHIVQLNGSEISKKDRLNAELYYVTQVAHSTNGMDEAAILAIYPRFEELCKVHGRPDTSDEFRKATSEILKDRLIEITLVSKSEIDGPVKASFKRKVLGTMTVKNLKNLAQKLLRIPSQRQQLVFLTNDPDYADVKVKVYLKDDMRQISFYDIAEGEEIIVLGAPAGK